jgi:pyrimidine operon attenuation protein/uracil phosphoribosyltransferase
MPLTPPEHPTAAAHAPGLVLDAAALRRALGRVALQIAERVPRVDRLVLVGICRRGVPLARRIQAAIFQAEGVRVPVGALDVALYRDDLFHPGAGGAAAATPSADTPIVVGREGPPRLPEVRATELPFDVNGRLVVLVDDVLCTGRTARAALEALLHWGRPAAVKLAVLIDRGHRELPLHADFVGAHIETRLHERVEVRLAEDDGQDGVFLTQLGGGR